MAHGYSVQLNGTWLQCSVEWHMATVFSWMAHGYSVRL